MDLNDGGLGCNNPSKWVLNEAKVVFPTCQIGCLVSIGTGQAEVISIRKPGFFSRLCQQMLLMYSKQCLTDYEATHEDMLHLFANSPNIYF